MAPDDETVFLELKQLRRGRGIASDNVARRFGPALTGLCGVGPADDSTTTRAKVAARITAALECLPHDMRVVAAIGLGLDPRARHRFLEHRLNWLADETGFSIRTTFRRLDEALRLLSEQLVASGSESLAEPHDSTDRWYLASLDVFLRLDTETPETFEERTIVAAVDGLTELETSISVPPHSAADDKSRQLETEVVWGARLTAQEKVSSSYFGLVISLPKPLRVGEEHTFASRTRIPTGQLMAPRYVAIPFVRNEFFRIRIRFNPAALPRRIWRVDAAPPQVVYDQQPSEDLLAPNDFGEVGAEFENLRRGFGYGIAWDDPNAAE